MLFAIDKFWQTFNIYLQYVILNMSDQMPGNNYKYELWNVNVEATFTSWNKLTCHNQFTQTDIFKIGSETMAPLSMTPDIWSENP